MNRINYLFILACFSAGSLYAQDPETEYQFYKEKYPEESAVVLKNSEEYFVERVDDSLRIKVKHYKEVLILGDVKSVLTTDKVHVGHFTEVQDIVAKTLLPHKKKYKDIEVTNFKETFDQSDFIFFDGTKSINFTYPALQKGAKTVLSYTETLKDPHFTGSFFAASYLPVEESEFRIVMDPGVTMDFIKFQMEGTEITEEDLMEKDKKVKVFRMRNVEKIVYEESAPSYNYRAPHIGTKVVSYLSSKGDTVRILGSQKDLFDWYWTFIDGLKETRDPEIENLVAQILEGETEDYEKVRKIFYWVQENIKYIAFEEGMRGFIPHPGAYVCEKRYGDCKDMASIIVNMLYHAGIDAYYTWVGSRDLPYKYTEFPSPSTDNHMIATYFHKGKPIYLDATGSFTPYGYPTSMIQGKETLIAISRDSFLIETVPVLPMEANITMDSSFYTLVDGTLTGTGKTYMNGYSKVYSRPYLTRADKVSVDDYVKRVIMRGNNKFRAEAYDIANLTDFQLPTVINYSFTVPDYYKEVGDEIYINLNSDKNFGGSLIDGTRKYPFENKFRYSIRNISVVEVPEGYIVSSIPENSSHSTPVFHYNITYKVVDGKIILEKEYGVNYLLLEKESFELWNEAFRKMLNDNRQVVILQKENK